MRAVVRKTFGGPDVLEVREVEYPEVGVTDVLVRVRAISVNVAEWYGLTGTPYIARLDQGIFKPKSDRLGADFAGTVERVGGSVQAFRPGQEVFGGTTEGTAFAEYVVVPEDETLAAKPSNISFEEAAAVATAGITALQAARDHGGVRPGAKVLINGASGAVGSFAVQIAKALGADVTGVCSTRNVELVRSCGADRVIDYTREDFTRTDDRYDVLIDVAGSRSWADYRRILEPRATIVIVGASRGGRVLGPLAHILRIRLAAMRSRQKVAFFIGKFNRGDLMFLAELLEAGTVTPIIDRRYELADIADAFRHVGEGHSRANVVATI